MGESPHVMYLHIASHGDAVPMAKAIHQALALTKTPGPDAGPAAPPAAEPGFDQNRSNRFSGTPEKSTPAFFKSECPGRNQSPTRG